MSSIGTGYDLSCSTISPDGRVFQIEYASKAVENSGTAVGIKCIDGIVLGVEKLILSKMLEQGSNKRIFNIDRHVGMTFAGLSADARQLANRAQQECASYKSFYMNSIEGRVLNERISNYVQSHTLYGHIRPFGCSVIMGVYEKNQPQLYMIEPSGIAYGYLGIAVGKAKQAAKGELDKLNYKEMTVEKALLEVARIIYSTHDEVKDKEFELEMSWICEKSNFQHQMVPKDILQKVVQQAQKLAEEMETV